MPKAELLPETITMLVNRNAIDVDSGRDFDQHVARLIEGIDDPLM